MATVSFQLIALNFLVSNNHNKDTKTYKKNPNRYYSSKSYCKIPELIYQ